MRTGPSRSGGTIPPNTKNLLGFKYLVVGLQLDLRWLVKKWLSFWRFKHVQTTKRKVTHTSQMGPQEWRNKILNGSRSRYFTIGGRHSGNQVNKCCMQSVSVEGTIPSRSNSYMFSAGKIIWERWKFPLAMFDCCRILMISWHEQRVENHGTSQSATREAVHVALKTGFCFKRYPSTPLQTASLRGSHHINPVILYGSSTIFRSGIHAI